MDLIYSLKFYLETAFTEQIRAAGYQTRMGVSRI